MTLANVVNGPAEFRTGFSIQHTGGAEIRCSIDGEEVHR